MQKWIYREEEYSKKLVCYDLGEITSFEIEPYDRKRMIKNGYCDRLSVGSLKAVADGVCYYCISKVNVVRGMGQTSCVPWCNAKTDDLDIGDLKQDDIHCGEYYIPSVLKDGEEIDGKKLRNSNYYKGHTISTICCDPRLLAMRNIVWSIYEQRKKLKVEDILSVIDSVPTREEALDYLHRNEFTDTALSWSELQEKRESDPEWETRICTNFKEVKF